ncbi:hypothetical protein [Pararhodobacter zhoushanensis]|nr:hypothetical protein [Pararhodobacter zhoushanensis]
MSFKDLTTRAANPAATPAVSTKTPDATKTPAPAAPKVSPDKKPS